MDDVRSVRDVALNLFYRFEVNANKQPEAQSQVR